MTEPRRILLINPNSSTATTAAMVAIASSTADGRCTVVGATATRAPPMIVEPAALLASAPEVLEIALANASTCDGFIVSAFGDPGLVEIRRRIPMPVVAAIPNQKRTITALTSDELKFSNPKTPSGMTLMTVWKRAAVR